MTLRGADPATVRRALADGDPLPGTAGFAGDADDRLVRDVLGRIPLYAEREAADPTTAWAFRPTDLSDPVPVPAGAVADADGARTAWELPDLDPDADREAALARVEDALSTAADRARERAGDVAVAFSGGVDSALVAALLDAPLYVAGFPDGHDVAAARESAAAMGRDLTVVSLDHADLERATPRVARATGRTNAMDVEIALPLYLVAERVAADGFDALAVGQGADELFGGYEKVVRLDDRIEAETVRGAVRETVLTLPDQLPRDVLAVEAAGVASVAPLLHDDVVEAALRLPAALLADETERKTALRAVAARYLPESVAGRPKKAVQYGSLVARELDRLARRAGYKRRMDDHVTRYVESLLDGG